MLNDLIGILVGVVAALCRIWQHHRLPRAIPVPIRACPMTLFPSREMDDSCSAVSALRRRPER